MASKEFEKYLASLPQDKKAEVTGLGKEAAKEIDLGTIQKTDTTQIIQHSTPNDTYLDAHRTQAPTTPETPPPPATTPPQQRNNAFTQLEEAKPKEQVQQQTPQKEQENER